MGTGFRKKVTAVLAAGALALTWLSPITASAAYVDMERENWATFADAYAAAWDQEMAASQESGTSSGELTLELGDFMRTMLGSILAVNGESMDFSWLSNIGLQAAASKEEGNIFSMALGLCLNDTVLASLELPIDLENDMVRFRVPEISGNYLGAPFDFETEEDRQQWQRLKEVLNPEFLAELAADGDEIAELLKRYGDILFERMTDADSGETTETLEGLEESFTVEEGRLYAVDLAEVTLEMAKQARDDEQLKEMIENLGTFSSDEDIYKEYQQAMDDAIRDMEADMPELSELESDDGENYISSKIWLDAEGRCAGREFTLFSDGEKEIQLAWLNVREGDQAALRMHFMTGEGGSDESVVLSGVGTITDGKLNGEYTVTSNVSPQLDIVVSDYDVDAEMGDIDGTYKLAFAGEADSSQTAFSPESFALTVDVERRAKEEIDNLSLSLTMNDALIAALHLKSDESVDLSIGSDAGEGVVYDANDQEDLQKYAAEVNPEAIIENCRKAGVPDEFIVQVAGLVVQMMQPKDTATQDTATQNTAAQDTATQDTAAQDTAAQDAAAQDTAETFGTTGMTETPTT